jgi:hypothetical protein
MLEIIMRPKHQLTLPAQIVRETKLSPDHRLEFTYTNGVIVLTPKSVASSSHVFDLMAYAEIGKRFFWGGERSRGGRVYSQPSPDCRYVCLNRQQHTDLLFFTNIQDTFSWSRASLSNAQTVKF